MHGLSEIVAANEAASAPRLDDVREKIAKGLEVFVKFPPNSPVQTGFLAALNYVAKEVLQEDINEYPYKDAAALLASGNTHFLATAPADENAVPCGAVGPCSKLPDDHPARTAEGAHSPLPEDHPVRLHLGRTLSVEAA